MVPPPMSSRKAGLWAGLGRRGWAATSKKDQQDKKAGKSSGVTTPRGCACLQVDKETLEMLRGMNMANLPGISVVQPQVCVCGVVWCVMAVVVWGMGWGE